MRSGKWKRRGAKVEFAPRRLRSLYRHSVEDNATVAVYLAFVSLVGCEEKLVEMPSDGDGSVDADEVFKEICKCSAPHSVGGLAESPSKFNNLLGWVRFDLSYEFTSFVFFPFLKKQRALHIPKAS